jgi:hypothetical protein
MAGRTESATAGRPGREWDMEFLASGAGRGHSSVPFDIYYGSIN